MSRDSTPDSGSRLDRLIEEQGRREAAIAQQIVKKSLHTFTARSNDALDSTFGAMDRRLDRLQRRLDETIDRAERNLRWQGLMLLPAAVASILILAAAFWALPNLMWPQLENEALARTGLFIATDTAGERWILFPEGSTISYPDRPQGAVRAQALEPMYIRIPEG